MITLNLISPQYKKELKLREICIIIKNITLAILIFTTVSSLILFSAQTILTHNYSKVVQETTLVSKPLPQPQREIKDLNEQLKTIQKIQEQYVSFSEILFYLSKSIPQGVIINSLEIDRVSKTVNIKGKAGLREDFLNFKENLTSSKIFTDPEFPISSILEKENITFDIKTGLNLEAFNKTKEHKN